MRDLNKQNIVGIYDTMTLEERAFMLELLLQTQQARTLCEMEYGRIIDLWHVDDFNDYWGKAHDERDSVGYPWKEIHAEDWEKLVTLHHKTFDAEQGMNWHRIEHLCDYVKTENEKEKANGNH